MPHPLSDVGGYCRRECYGTVYLPYALERKYPNTNKTFHWQYVFPSPALSVDPRSGRRQRHHVYESVLQEATPMTLRHSHAVTRLREGENIRVLQEDLGHRLVETTLAYSRYILPPDLVSPADRLSISPRVQQPMRPASAVPCHGGGP